MTLSSLLQHVADASYRTYSRATTNGGDGESTPESAILLISFNIASAALLMATVIFDAWKLSKKHNLLQIEYVNRQPDARASVQLTCEVLESGKASSN